MPTIDERKIDDKPTFLHFQGYGMKITRLLDLTFNVLMNKSEFSFTHQLRVRFGEVDYQGIVFNAHYLAYFDVALTEYLRAAGITYAADLEDRDENDFNVVKSVLDLKQPARADDLLEVAVKIGRIGRSSLTWELAIFRDGEPDPCTFGEIIWVYANQYERKSVPIPEALRQKLLAVGS